MAPYDGTQQWHHVHSPKVGRCLPPPTMAHYNGTLQWHHVHSPLQWHPGATSNLPKWFVALPPIGSKNPYSYRYLGKIGKVEHVEEFFLSFYKTFTILIGFDFAFSRWFRLLGFSHTHGDRPSLHRGSILVVRCVDVAAPEVSVSSLFHVLVARCHSLRVEMPVLPQRWRLVHLSGVVEKAKALCEMVQLISSAIQRCPIVLLQAPTRCAVLSELGTVSFCRSVRFSNISSEPNL